MKILTLGLLSLISVSCATQTKWIAKESGKNKISFKSGTVEVTPIGSHDGYSQTKDMLSVNVKITNSTRKSVKVNPNDIVAKLLSGETVAPMSDQELKTYTNKVGAFATSIASGPYADPSATQNNLFLEYSSKQIKKGTLPPEGFIVGELYFAIPKAGADSVDFRFYESLDSKNVIVFIKDKSNSSSKKSNRRSRGIASQK